MKLVFTLFLFLFCFTSLVAPAQDKSDNVWAFGCRMGLDFNSGTPVSIPTKMFTDEGGCASVCDKNTGELLFYTDGEQVWNRNHMLMPNGGSLTGLGFVYNPSPWWFFDTVLTVTGSCTQGALIVPVPQSKNLYYVFTNYTSDYRSRWGDGIYYSIVDMSLNNGLGDVVVGKKHVLLTDDATERLTAVSGTDCTVWVLTVTTNSAFKAWAITPFGLDPNPVISDFSSSIVGQMLLPSLGTPIGTLSSSEDGKKLALCCAGNILAGLATFAFNNSNGIVSDPFILDASSGYYGACFSADGTKLYATQSKNYVPNLKQYDLSNGNAVTRIPKTDPIVKNLKLGPDGKIYCIAMAGMKNQMPGANHMANYLDNNLPVFRIDYPNQPGLACGFDYTTQWPLKQLIPFNPLRYIAGFSNVIRRPIPDSSFNVVDTVMCKGKSLLLKGNLEAEKYLWNDGSEAVAREIAQAGKYWVVSQTECYVHVDTFIVWEAEDFEFTLGADTTVCNQDIFELEVSVPRANYYWQDGSTENTYRINNSGMYWVQVDRDGCVQVDSIDVALISLQQDLGSDIVFCKGEPIPSIRLYSNASVPGSTIYWSTGSTDSSIMVMDTGNYWVRVTIPPYCESTDTFRLESELCNCYIFVANAFSPNGDGYNDHFQPIIESGCAVSAYAFQIYNRFGERVFSTSDSKQGWDGQHKEQPVDVGTYFYEIRYWGGSKNVLYYQKGDVLLIR